MTTPDRDLMPCPWCDAEPNTNFNDTPDVWSVYCNKCEGKIAKFGNGPAEAVKNWNTRTSPGCCDGLVSALEQLRRMHRECDDTWYSCPKSEDGCANDQTPKNTCTCGADEHNAIINAALAEHRAAQGKKEKSNG